MLNVQKPTSDNTGLGFVKSVSISVIHPTKFVLASSIPTPKIKMPKEEILATRKIRVDLSDSKPKRPIILEVRNNTNLSGFVTFVVE